MDIAYQKITHRKIEPKTMQFTIDKDFNVPDTLDDITDIVTFSKLLSISEDRQIGDRLYIKGSLKFQLLYYSDGANFPSPIEGAIDFDEMLRINPDFTGTIQTNALLEDMKISIIHPRKISVTALITLHALCIVDDDFDVISEFTDDRDIEAMYEERVFDALVCSSVEVIPLSGDFIIEKNLPNINNLLFHSCTLTDFDSLVAENKIKLYGRLRFFFIYMAENETSPVYFSHEMTFEKEFETSGCNDSCFCFSCPRLCDLNISAAPDDENELRSINVSGRICCSTNVWCQNHIALLKDAYMAGGSLLCKNEDKKYTKLLGLTDEIIRLNETIPDYDSIGKITEIIFSQSEAVLEDTAVTPEGLNITGNINVSFFSRHADDDIIHADCIVLDFNEMLPLASAIPCKSVPIVSLIPISTSIRAASSGELEVKISLKLNAEITADENGSFISSAESVECIKSAQRRITCYFVKPGDTLFDIGKKYKIKLTDIQKMNPEVKIVPGDRIYMYTCSHGGDNDEEGC